MRQIVGCWTPSATRCHMNGGRLEFVSVELLSTRDWQHFDRVLALPEP